ncbi:hypothetical protein P7C70_g9015, partial [Phenoliferia sp. Uapishka_3]
PSPLAAALLPLAHRFLVFSLDSSEFPMLVTHSANCIEICSSPPSSPPVKRVAPVHHTAGGLVDRTGDSSTVLVLSDDDDDDFPTIDELLARYAARKDERSIALNTSSPTHKTPKKSAPRIKKPRALASSSSPRRSAKEPLIIKSQSERARKPAAKRYASANMTPKAKAVAELEFKGAKAGVWKEPKWRKLPNSGWLPNVVRTGANFGNLVGAAFATRAAANLAEQDGMQAFGHGAGLMPATDFVAGDEFLDMDVLQGASQDWGGGSQAQADSFADFHDFSGGIDADTFAAAIAAMDPNHGAFSTQSFAPPMEVDTLPALLSPSPPSSPAVTPSSSPKRTPGPAVTPVATEYDSITAFNWAQYPGFIRFIDCRTMNNGKGFRVGLVCYVQGIMVFNCPPPRVPMSKTCTIAVYIDISRQSDTYKESILKRRG